MRSLDNLQAAHPTCNLTDAQGLTATDERSDASKSVLTLAGEVLL